MSSPASPGVPLGSVLSPDEWDRAGRCALADAERENAERDARSRRTSSAPLERVVPTVLEDRGDGVRVLWDLTDPGSPVVVAVDVHDPDRPRRLRADLWALRLYQLSIQAPGGFSVPIVAAIAFVVILAIAVKLVAAVGANGLFAIPAGVAGAGVVAWPLHELSRRRWRRIDLADLHPDISGPIATLVRAHGLAIVRGNGEVQPALLAGAGRQRLWETARLLVDLDPATVREHHDVIVGGLQDVDDMHAAVLRLPPPVWARSEDRRRAQVRGQRALERSSSASLQLRTAINELNADHDTTGR